MRTLIILLVVLGSFLNLNAAGLSANFMERALAVMKSSDAGKRKTAYRTFQHLGIEAMPSYRKVLERAKLHHQGAMRRAMGVRGNPYATHVRVAEELATERKRVMLLIHTDWKKDAGKIRMLGNELEGIERKYKTRTKLVRSKTESIDRNIGTAFQALVEIQWEIASIDRSEDGENTSELPDKEELEDLVCKESFEAEEWMKQKAKWESTQKSVNALDAAKKDNAACKWANASQRNFSDHYLSIDGIKMFRPSKNFTFDIIFFKGFFDRRYNSGDIFLTLFFFFFYLLNKIDIGFRFDIFKR